MPIATNSLAWLWYTNAHFAHREPFRSWRWCRWCDQPPWLAQSCICGKTGRASPAEYAAVDLHTQPPRPRHLDPHPPCPLRSEGHISSSLYSTLIHVCSQRHLSCVQPTATANGSTNNKQFTSAFSQQFVKKASRTVTVPRQPYTWSPVHTLYAVRCRPYGVKLFLCRASGVITLTDALIN